MKQSAADVERLVVRGRQGAVVLDEEAVVGDHNVVAAVAHGGGGSGGGGRGVGQAARRAAAVVRRAERDVGLRGSGPEREEGEDEEEQARHASSWLGLGRKGRVWPVWVDGWLSVGMGSWDGVGWGG